MVGSPFVPLFQHFLRSLKISSPSSLTRSQGGVKEYKREREDMGRNSPRLSWAPIGVGAQPLFIYTWFVEL